jgi:hypothetical protein
MENLEFEPSSPAVHFEVDFPTSKASPKVGPGGIKKLVAGAMAHTTSQSLTAKTRPTTAKVRPVAVSAAATRPKTAVVKS